jgi:oligopeptide transport system substrate-binding protein
MVQKRLLQRSAGAVALGAVVLGAAGFSAARTTPQTRPGALPQASYTPHVLNYPNVGTQFPGTFDPADVTDSQSIMVMYMTYGNLVKFDSNNKVIPDLASGWKISNGGKTYTFTLRDTKFSDGKPVTAADVVYSIDRALNPKADAGQGPSPVASLYLGHIVGVSSYKGKGDVSGVKALNSKTVQFTLDSPISFFLQTLSYPTADIVEKGTPVAGLVTTNPMKNQVSSGPFKISAYRENSSLTLVPNTGYYNYKNIKLTRIDMPFIKDQGTEYAAYESGQVQIGYVPTSRLKAAKMMPDFHSSPILAIDYITYNMAEAPFNNKNLRLAMSYAINRDLINNDVLHGFQKTIYSVVPQGIPGYDESGKNYVPSYNMGKAKMYLALAKKEMGSKFPSTVTIKYQNVGPDVRNEYTELQYEWKQLGVNVNVQGVTFNEWLKLVAKPTTSLNFTGSGPWVENLWIDDYPDAQDFTTNLLTSDSVYNVGNYNSSQFNSLTNQALTATGSARDQLYVKASRVALNDVAWSMIGQETTNWRWDQTHIKGMAVWTSTNNPEPKNFDWTGVDVQ